MVAILTPISGNVKVPWQSRDFCPRASTLLGIHKHLPIKRLIPIRCKCWSCDYCSKINADRLRKKVLSGKPTKFITLTTLCQSGETAKDIAKRCRPQIARLLTMIRKEWGSIECAIILELTKRGLPHWHLCARCGFIPQHWLSDKWNQLTGARIVDIRRIKNQKYAANYVAKYTSKTARATTKEKIGRLFSFTSNYLIREQTNPQETPWTFSRIKQHPLEVLSNTPNGIEVEYHDGLFDLIDNRPPNPMTGPEILDVSTGPTNPRPPPEAPKSPTFPETNSMTFPETATKSPALLQTRFPTFPTFPAFK